MVEECMVCHEPTGKAGRGEDSWYTPNGIGPFCEQCWDDAWPVMVLDAPDPALLALASFAARIVRGFYCNGEGFKSAMPSRDVDQEAWCAGVIDGGWELAPGIADAIAALLAPAGADGAATRVCRWQKQDWPQRQDEPRMTECGHRITFNLAGDGEPCPACGGRIVEVADGR